MTEPRFWIGVAARAHVTVAVESGFCMFAHGRHSAVRRLRPGDCFAYYAPTDTLGGGDAVRAFVAIGQVAEGEPVASEVMTGTAGWQRAACYWPAEPADIYPLLDQFSFIKDRRHWGMHFRKSLFEIGAADFALIRQAMRAMAPA